MSKVSVRLHHDHEMKCAIHFYYHWKGYRHFYKKFNKEPEEVGYRIRDITEGESKEQVGREMEGKWRGNRHIQSKRSKGFHSLQASKYGKPNTLQRKQ